MRRLMVLPMALVLAFATVIALPFDAAAIRQSPWTYNPATRHTYAQIFDVTWADAEAYGVKMGGHLVNVDDEAEQQWLDATFPEEWSYIGLNDRAHEGVWVWSSGKRVTYANWQDTQPDDWKGFDPLGEDAAVLHTDQPGWIDMSDRWLGVGIIEIPGRVHDVSSNQLPQGFHDGFDQESAIGDECYAAGWAWDPDSQKRDVTVRILAQRQDIEIIVPKEIWRGPADQVREDLPPEGFDLTAGFGVDLRPSIEWGIPYKIWTQGKDLQTGEWVNLEQTPRLLTCTPF